MDIESETREVTKTRTFVTLNPESDNEAEFRVGRLLDFVRKIMGTDGFMTGLRGLNHSEKKIAEALESHGLVAHTHSAGWYEDDREGINELWKELMCIYYGDTTKDELDASMVR